MSGLRHRGAGLHPPPSMRPAPLLARLVATGLAVALALALAGAPSQAATPEVMLIPSRDAVPLCVAEAGNPAGYPLVFIHGFSQSHAVFARQFSSALAQEFRLLALDMRGHGCSGKPWATEAYASPRPWAGDIAALLAAKQVERPILVGWSAGGYWSLDFVREHGAAAIAGLVMAGSHGGLIPTADDAQVRERAAAMRKANLEYPLDPVRTLELSDQFVARMAAQPLPPDLARVMHAGTLMLPAYARQAMTSRDMDNADLAPRLDIPVLFILGAADHVVAPAALQALATRLPAAQVRIYADTGHSAFAEQPEQFNRDLAEFARRVSGAPRP